MKKLIETRSEEDLLRTHNVRGKVPGWFFRIRERSASHWEAEGLDARGRNVVVEGSDPDKLMSEAEAQVQRILDARSAT